MSDFQNVATMVEIPTSEISTFQNNISEWLRMYYDFEFFFMCAVPTCRLCILSWFLIPVQDLPVQPNHQKLVVNKDFLQIVPWSSLFPTPVENNDFNEIIRYSQC